MIRTKGVTMVTLNRIGGQEVDNTTEFRGKSTDTKPISSDIANMSTFLEADTGNLYFYDSDTQTWILPQ
jgi:hypothetical protein